MPGSRWKDGEDVKALTFDCYGTLIDWKTGMRQALEEEGILDVLTEPVEDFLERRQRHESTWTSGAYRHYREILALSLQQALKDLELRVDDRAALRFADSIKDWPPFEETTTALRRLGSYWPLSILSNVERGPLLKTVARLGIPFAELISAEDVRAYKPDKAHFKEARRRLGDRADGLVHVSCSLHHDVEPANALGIPVIWINRESQRLPADLQVRAVAKNLLDLCNHLGV